MKEKWNLDMSPEEFYKQKEDPFNVQNNPFELWKIDKVLEFMLQEKKKYFKIADVGCGEGYYTKYYVGLLKKYGILTGYDISETAIERAEFKYEDICFTQLDITKETSCSSNHLIILSEILYYIEPKDRINAINNIYEMFGNYHKYGFRDLLIVNSQSFSIEKLKSMFNKINWRKCEEYKYNSERKTIIMIGEHNGSC